MVDDPLLIFDLGNVILRHDDELLFNGLSAACRNPGAALPVLKEKIRTIGVDRKSTGEFFEAVRGEIGFEGDFDRFEPIWCSHFSHDPGMEELVRGLARHYQLVILSNTNDSHWKFLTGAYDILKVPHALYTSFQLGMEKPSLEIYRHVLEAENRKAEDAIFIDDRLENVEAANAVGIHGIHFTGREALERDLASYGITTTA